MNIKYFLVHKMLIKMISNNNNVMINNKINNRLKIKKIKKSKL